MADGVAITAGAGTTILTDDTGAGGHAQVVKLAISTDGSATLIPAEATNGLDVDVTRSALPTGAATEAELDTQTGILTTIDADTGGILTAVQLIDDTVATLGTDTYTEATTKGTTIGAVRRDADTTLVGTTNEIGPLQMDANGRLKVEAFSGETLPVSGTVAVTGVATETTLASILTAQQIMDDWDETDRAKVNIIAGQVGVAGGAGAVSALTQRVVLATDTTLPNVSGDIAHDAADSGSPVKIGTKAANALPTAVANNDRANAISDLFGRVLTAQIDPAMQVWKSYNDTSSRAAASAQVVWDPTSGKRIAVTSLVISTYGTTAGRIFLFFAADADLTYSAGTDQPLFVGSFAPSATAKPGAVINFDPPVFCTTADRRLHYQNDAAISVDITLVGYEW